MPAVVFYDTEFAVPDQLVRLSAGPQRRDAGLLPGQGARHPRHLRRLPRARLPPPEPVPARPGAAARVRRRPDEPYSIVRFVSWQAVHDRRETGLTVAQKRDLVEVLAAATARVLDLVGGAAAARPGRLRGEGPGRGHPPPAGPRADDRRASRRRCRPRRPCSACPAVMIATTGRGYTDDQERRYGLVRHFTERRVRAGGRGGRGAAGRLAARARAGGARAAARGQDRRDAVDGRLLRDPSSRRRDGSMCGIAGTFGFGDEALIRAMTDTIAHRGPDGDGLLRRRRASASATAGWPSRTSKGGSQPMSERGRLGRRRLQRRDLQLPGAARAASWRAATGCTTTL